MRVRIVNENGSGSSTTITDQETGKSLDTITEIRIHPIVVNEPIVADLTMTLTGLSLLCEADVRVVCPECGKMMICFIDDLIKRK